MILCVQITYFLPLVCLPLGKPQNAVSGSQLGPDKKIKHYCIKSGLDYENKI